MGCFKVHYWRPAARLPPWDIIGVEAANETSNSPAVNITYEDTDGAGVGRATKSVLFVRVVITGKYAQELRGASLHSTLAELPGAVSSCRSHLNSVLSMR